MNESHEVLVVEDDEVLRETVVEYLDDNGYPVIAASNGREALEKLDTTDRVPCLIVLDLMMPVMDGVAFRREQRRSPKLSNIPVVVVSAYQDMDARAAELEPLAAALKKPFKLADLLAVVEEHCRR
jgi:CheY-like chemotaxis protein